MTTNRFLANGIVFEINKSSNGSMDLIHDGVFVCQLIPTSMRFNEWKSTQEYILNLWNNYCGIALYDESSANYKEIIELKGFISSRKKEELGFDPDYYRITDRVCDDPMLSSNGGDYSFWRIFIPTKDGKYVVKYRTSADFDYCEVCGSFGRHDYDCETYYVVDTLPEGAYPCWC